MSSENLNDMEVNDLYPTSADFGVDWKYTPELTDLQSEVQGFKTYTDYHMSTNVDVWRSYRDGNRNFKPQKNKSKVVRKVIKKSNEWKYPSLEEPFLSTANLFSLDSTTASNNGIDQMNTILNYQFTKEMNRVDLINKLVRKCGDDGTVIMKALWEYKSMEVQTVVDLNTTEITDAMTILDLDKETGKCTVTENKVVKNTFDIEFCDIESIHMDPAARGDVEKARSITHVFRSTLSELTEDSRYQNLGELTLGDLGVDFNGSNYNSATYLTDVNIQDLPRKDITVTEYWGDYDVNGDGIAEPIVIAWIGDVIVRMEDNPYPLQEKPFVLVKSLPDDDSNYGSSDASLLMDIQDITSAINRGLIDTLGRTAIGQTIVTKGAFDSYELERLQQGKSAEINQGFSLQNSMEVVTYPELPQSAHIYLQSLDSEAEALTGVKGFGQGITGASLGDTATAVRSATDAVSKRELSLLRRLAYGMIQMARKAIRLNIEYLTDEDILRITGEEIQFERSQFIPLTFVNIEIATPELNAAKSDKLVFMLQTLGPDMGIQERNKILAKIAMLDGMEDLAADLRAYEPPPPSEEEIALQKAEVEYKQAQAEEMHARASYYQAMADKVSSQKDLHDQEYLDKEDGKDVTRQLAFEEGKQEMSDGNGGLPRIG